MKPCINARCARATGTAGREGGLSDPRARLVKMKPPLLQLNACSTVKLSPQTQFDGRSGRPRVRSPGNPCCNCQCCIAVLFWLFFKKIIHNSKIIGPFDLILILLGALAHFSQDRLF